MVTLANILLYLYPSINFERGDVRIRSGQIYYWSSDLGPQPTPAEIDAATLPANKAAKLEEIRSDAASRILAKWPTWAQTNCALGVYPEATVAQCSADIAAVVIASNVAEDAVTTATTVAEVEAVTATWPTL